MRLSRLPPVLAGRFGEPGTTLPDSGRKNAAVAVVLRPPGRGDVTDARLGNCDALVIERARSRRDPWSGQMALPGGRLDPADAGLVGAAIRETMEETLAAGRPNRGDLVAAGTLLGRSPPSRSGPSCSRWIPGPWRGWPAVRWRQSTGSGSAPGPRQPGDLRMDVRRRGAPVPVQPGVIWIPDPDEAVRGGRSRLTRFTRNGWHYTQP